MRGLAVDFEPADAPPAPYDHQVCGLLAASDFPEPGLIRETIAKGQAHDPETTWVIRDRDLLVKEALDELGLEYVALALNPFWKRTVAVAGPTQHGKPLPKATLYDLRAQVREQEILHSCNLVIVFQKPTTQTLKAFTTPAVPVGHVHVIERGGAPARKRGKGRKPVGV